MNHDRPIQLLSTIKLLDSPGKLRPTWKNQCSVKILFIHGPSKSWICKIRPLQGQCPEWQTIHLLTVWVILIVMTTGLKFENYFRFRYFFRSLLYRCWNGEVYGSSKGTLRIENSTVGDVITMTYDRALRHFYIQKVWITRIYKNPDSTKKLYSKLHPNLTEKSFRILVHHTSLKIKSILKCLIFQLHTSMVQKKKLKLCKIYQFVACNQNKFWRR